MSTRPSLVIAGATGFIGTRLVEAAIAAGYQVTRLVRSLPREVPEHCTDVVWNPSAHDLDERVLAGAAGVVCLNGAPLVGKVWTRSYKQTLWRSRIDSVDTIVDAIVRLPADNRPACFISGSAIGFYGPDCGDAVLHEGSSQGAGFLAELCGAWESCAQRCAEEAGVRTVSVRTGLVMGADGGLLGILQHLYRAGLGGQLSDGKAWMSTISVIDHVRAILFLVARDDIEGPVNLTCSEPCENKVWNRLLGRHLQRPAVLRVPCGPLATLFPYAVGETVLASQRALPIRLLDAGFIFTAPHVADIFDSILPQKRG